MKKTDRHTDLTQVVVEAISQGLASNFQDTFLSIWSIFVKHLSPRCWHVKLGLSEKHTKFEEIFLMVLTNQLIYLVNEEDLIKLCVTKQSKN